MRIIRFLGIYGPDFFVFGLIAALLIAIPAATDKVSGWMSGVALFALVAPRILAQLHDRFLSAMYKAIARAAAWLVGKVLAIPGLKKLLIAIVVVAVVAAVVLTLGAGIVSHSAPGRVGVIAAIMLALAGIGGQYGWFSWRAARWRRANP